MIYFFLFLSAVSWSFDCHYNFTVWNTRTRSSEGPYLVKKWKKDLSETEKGPYGCTICEEDQVEMSLPNGIKFTACKKVAHIFADILSSKDFPVVTILGYRPSKSRGPVDSQGKRTIFSSHAFGVSADINEDYNGLYSNCIQWGPECVLIKGGPYLPGLEARSLTDKASIVTRFEGAGFFWGGLIAGQQKDFMHFSPDGY